MWQSDGGGIRPSELRPLQTQGLCTQQALLHQDRFHSTVESNRREREMSTGHLVSDRLS